MWGGLNALCPFFLRVMRSVKVRYSANNEVTVQWAELPYPNPKAGDGEVQQRETVEAKFTDTELRQRIKATPLVAIPCSDGVTRILHRETGEVKDSPISYLTLSQNCKKQDSEDGQTPPKPGYGILPNPSKFRKAARHTLLECGSVFTRQLKASHRGYFVTLTLPGSSEDALDAISKWSGYLVRVAIQRLRDTCRESVWFYCWELQKRQALHLHLFAGVPNEVEGRPIMEQIRQSWYSAMERLTLSGHGDFFTHRDGQFCTARQYWQSDIQEVEHSPAQYISKYVSKGANAIKPESVGSDTHPRYPSRWWGCSRFLRQLVEEQRFDYTMQALGKEESEQIYRDVNDWVEMYEPIQKYETEGEICNEKNPKQVFGYYKKTTYYFDPDDFPAIQFLVKEFCRQRHLVRPPNRHTAKHHPWKYEGDPIDEYLPAELYL